MIAFLGCFRVACKRPTTLAAGMAGDNDCRLPDVVVVIALRQLMAETIRVLVGTRLTVCRDERWVDRDADYVRPGRHWILPVAAVQYEILTCEREAIGVSPACTDSLIAGNVDGAAVPKLPGAWWHTTDGDRIRVRIQHAKTALGCTPDLARCRIDELIKSVVAEVEVVVARRKLE